MDDRSNQEQMEIRISPEGNSFVPFFPPSFSEFIVKSVYDKEERERFERYSDYGAPAVKGKIFCG